MIDIGNEVHLGPIDIRKKIMLWTLEPPTIIRKKGDFSGGPMAKTPIVGGLGLHSGWGTI